MNTIVDDIKSVRSSRTESKLIRPIVPIEKWIYDEYYIGPDAGSIYDFWRQHLIEIFRSDRKPEEYIDQILVDGSIGGGKTTFANMCMMRKLYELSCYENMQSLFNLMLSSKIAFIYFNITKDQAEQTGFGQLREMIDASPYFQENFRRNMKANSVVEWPEEKLSVTYASGTSGMIGGNLLGSILDEANFYQGDGKEAVAGEVQSKAAKLYTNIRNRGRSRFLRNGINHALNIVVSSSMYANSFMNKLKDECKDDPHTYYIETTIWDVKPKGTYSDERFYVFKGSDNLDPALCDTVPDVSNIMEVLGYGRCDNFENPVAAIKSFPEDVQRQYFIAIPTDFRKSFDDNLIQALQDIAGVSVSPIGRLFSSRYHYNLALDKSIENPLLAPEVTLSTKSDVTWKDLFKPTYEFEHKEKPRFIHFDQSYAGDKSGISCCYIDKVVETEEGPIPYIKFDFMFTIVPPKAPAQTAIYKLRELIPYLANVHGLTFGLITYDMFASIESMQILQSQGFPVEYQSVDRTDEAYLAFCNLLYEERVKFGYSHEFEDNLFNLIHYRSKKKVDHPAEGCFTGDTKISLVDGREVSILDLKDEYELGKDNYVYTYNEENKIIEPKKIRKVFKTKITDELYVITLDNGEIIKCTNNHKFMLRDGSYCEAQDLIIGNSLMPLYRKFPEKGSLQDYRMFYEPYENEWHFEHRRFVQSGEGNIVHHINFNKLDNSPNNLIRVTRNQHRKIHNRYRSENEMNKVKSSLHKYHSSMSDTERAKRSKAISGAVILANIDLGLSTKQLYIKRLIKELESLYRIQMIEEKFQVEYNKLSLKEKNKYQVLLTYSLNPSINENHRVRSKMLYEGKKDKFTTKGRKWYTDGVNTIYLLVTEPIPAGFTPGRTRKNHKIVDIKIIKSSEPVYDLEIEDNHNFALSAGVFVHNSKDTSDSAVGAAFNALRSESVEATLRGQDVEAWIDSMI